MNKLEELLRSAEHNLALVIARDEIDLANNTDNTIYILEIDTSSNAAGGRAAGFGFRRFKRIHGFEIKDNSITKFVESDDVDDIDIGYIARLPIMLSNGEEIMVSCSIDADIVKSLNARFQ